MLAAAASTGYMARPKSSTTGIQGSMIQTRELNADQDERDALELPFHAVMPPN